MTTKFSSIEAKIEKEDQALLLLTSLPPLYDTLVTTLLIGKHVLKLEDVTIILLKIEKVKQLIDNSKAGTFVVKPDSNCGRSVSREKNDRDKSRSKSKTEKGY